MQDKDLRNELVTLFREFATGEGDKCFSGDMKIKVTPLPASGGSRRYFRMQTPDGRNAIGTIGKSKAENIRFLHLAKHFAEKGINIPAIYKTGESGMSYLQEDLGQISLYDLIQKEPADENGERDLRLSPTGKYIEAAIDQLIMIQTSGACQEEERSIERWRQQVIWDLNYFKYAFLKAAGVEFDEYALETDIQNFTTAMSRLPEESFGFVYRDFQSRNVMVKDGKSILIDFQGGVYGPVVYDVVSFSMQANARYSESYRNYLFEYYLKGYCKETGADIDSLRSQQLPVRLLRTLQVLGAYGMRGLTERKAHFVTSIPTAMRNLKGLLDSGALAEYPELERCCRHLTQMPRFIERESKGLRVRVYSFSYKKGYPEDLTGNGGGFMFDCRAMHNPGRYPEYRHLTGKDRPVIGFLEKCGEVQGFVDAAFSLTSKAVARYLQRGFSELQIGFGCTGGQHRSVYCAEHLGMRLREAFPEAMIEIIHREQGIKS